jgi:very-short-patch-repair endonuclease
MLSYNKTLKSNSRKLRTDMTDAEQRLWSRVRGKQLSGVQFYRQKPIGGYIVDFYAPAARLVIELDGSQHLEAKHKENDQVRDHFLQSNGLKVLRFNNRQVLLELDAVVGCIFEVLSERIF